MRDSPLFFRKQQGLIREVLGLLPKAPLKSFKLYTFVQLLFNVLDVASVAIMGAIGALAINGIQSNSTNSTVQEVLDILNLSSFSFQVQVAVLGISAVSLMLFKVVMQYTFNKKVFTLLFGVSIELSKSLLSDTLEKQTKSELRVSYQEVQHAIGYGINATILGVLGVFSSLISDVFLLVLIGFLVVTVDPATFIISFLFFGTLSYLLYSKQNTRAYNLGVLQSQLNVLGNSQLQNTFLSYREIYLNGKQNYFVNKDADLRGKFRHVYISQLLFPNIGKYAVEVSIALSTLLMAAYQFSTQNAAHAAANLTIFIAAGSRIAPALLRIQNGMITLKGNLGQVTPTLELLNTRHNPEIQHKTIASQDSSDFNPELEVNDLCFKYPSSKNFELEISGLKIGRGEMVAIIGKSGSGKTSLVDLMLGLKVPVSGECLISGIPSREAVKKWPGRIAYVPQHVEIFEGSIAENIAIGEIQENIDVTRVIKLLKAVKLFAEVINDVDGVWKNIGGKQGTFSGGQRQRLGIARALYHEPSLIILDEATSALDGESEHIITELFLSLKSKVTIIAIAHRLRTVQASDSVLYMENGKIIASGSFEQLRASFGSDLRKVRILGI